MSSVQWILGSSAVVFVWSGSRWTPSEGSESEDLAEPGRGTGVDEEGTFIGSEVFPVPAAKRRQTVDRDKSLVSLPPERTHTRQIMGSAHIYLHRYK